MNKKHVQPFVNKSMKYLLMRFFVLSLLLFSFNLAYSQETEIRVTGTVVSEADNESLIGVTVTVKETKKGTVTDVNGTFSVNAKMGQTLVFSYIGFFNQEVKVTGSRMAISLREDYEALDEVIVIGYGTIKKKLNTGATVQVKGDVMQKLNTTNPMNALQGATPGVQITPTSGQPGSSVKMTIRGLGTITGSNPLYIVDGVLTGDISFLSNSDIASVDILKDAASAAIYGSQSSNGVVIITTRTGTKGSAKISFDGYFGLQNVAKKIDLLNASQYATVMNVQGINSGKSPLYANKATYLTQWGDTDWLDEMFVENAPMYNYSVGINGGSEGSIYSLSLGVTGQDGIVGGHDVSSYERYNFRINTEHSLYNNVLKVGQHLTFSFTNSTGIDVGGLYNNSLRGAFGTSPFLPMKDDSGNYLNNTRNAGVLYNGNTWAPWYSGEGNPYASMTMRESQSTGQRLIGDIYAELEPIKNLKIKTSLGVSIHAGGNRSFTPVYQLSMYSYRNNDDATHSLNKNLFWIWDNTVSYTFKVQEHQFVALAGMSANQYKGESMYLRNANLVIPDYEHAWIDNTTNTDLALLDFNGRPDDESMMASYFGRINYNYKEKYLATATLRADGSSRFAKNHRWGYFPSVSFGWVASSEDFLQDIESLEFLKVRVSWGQVGNQDIAAWQYVAPITTSNTNYYFGTGVAANSLTSAGAIINVTGAYPSRLSNENVKWETSEQANVGIDFRTLQSRLGMNLDWYRKINRDWLIQAPVLATAGADAPFINGGDVLNTGIELALTWRDTFGPLNYNIGINGSYNKNLVRNIPTVDGIIYGRSNELYNNASAAYRMAEEGFPIGYFWGYKTDGILQNDTEVASYLSELNNKTSNTLQGIYLSPGDVRYVDDDKNNVIDENDKTMIGDPNPDFTFGFNLGCNYKGLDFSVTAYGVAGNQILQSYRNYGNPFSNFTTDILDAWTPLNKSKTTPRLTNENINYHISDLFVKNGSFLRISNIQVGYDISKIVQWKYLSQLRVYTAIQNAFTLTAYNGMDPEVGYGTDDSTSGIDLGFYPHPRTILCGVNIKF